jgi:hypothetical protein
MWLGCITAAFGGLISFAFLMLDRRNVELVNYGREGLSRYELSVGQSMMDGDGQRRLLLGYPATGQLPTPFLREIATHTFWLRTIEKLFLLAFLAGALYAVLGFPGSKPAVPNSAPPSAQRLGPPVKQGTSGNPQLSVVSQRDGTTFALVSLERKLFVYRLDTSKNKTAILRLVSQQEVKARP